MPEHPNKNPPMPEFYYDPDKNSGNVLIIFTSQYKELRVQRAFSF
jgi:hypothetical protein